MSDWRTHIQDEPSNPSFLGTDVEVGSVFRLLAEGWTTDRVLARFPTLTDEDVRACFDYAAELLERAKLREEMMRRYKEAKEHPELGIPHEEVMRQLREQERLAGLPEEDE